MNAQKNDTVVHTYGKKHTLFFCFTSRSAYTFIAFISISHSIQTMHKLNQLISEVVHGERSESQESKNGAVTINALTNDQITIENQKKRKLIERSEPYIHLFSTINYDQDNNELSIAEKECPPEIVWFVRKYAHLSNDVTHSFIKKNNDGTVVFNLLQWSLVFTRELKNNEQTCHSACDVFRDASYTHRSSLISFLKQHILTSYLFIAPLPSEHEKKEMTVNNILRYGAATNQDRFVYMVALFLHYLHPHMSKEIAETKENYTQLITKYADLEQQAKEKNEEWNTLYSQQKENEAEIVRLTQKIEENQAKISDLEKNIQQQIEAHNRLQELETQTEQLNDQVAAKDNRIHTLTQQLKQAKTNLENTHARYDTLEKEKKELETQLKTKQEQITQNTTALIELQKICDAKTRDTQMADTESQSKAALVQQIAQLQQERAEEKKQLVEIGTTIQKRGNDLTTAKQTLAQKEQEITKLQQHLEIATQEAIKNQKTIDLLAQEKETLLKQLISEQKQYTAYTQKYETVKKELEIQKNSLKKTQQENVTLTTQLTEHIGKTTQLHTSSTQLEKQLKNITIEKENIGTELLQLKQLHEHVTNELNNAKKGLGKKVPSHKETQKIKKTHSTLTASSFDTWRYSTYGLLLTYVLTLIYYNKHYLQKTIFKTVR